MAKKEEKTNRKTETTSSREIDLVKVQIYADRCHAETTSQFSFAFVLFSLIAIFYGVYYQGLMSLNSALMTTGLVGIGAISISTILALNIYRDRYSKKFEGLSKMLETVKEGKELPPLNELDKPKRKQRTIFKTAMGDNSIDEQK